MLLDINKYKETFHLSVHLYSLFLLATFIPDILHIDSGFVKNAFWAIKILLACWVIYKNERSLSNFSSSESLFMILLFIYVSNLYFDIYINPLFFITNERGETDFFGFALCIIIALSFRYDPAFHSEKSFNFFWITLTFGLVMSYFFAIESYDLDSANIRYDANSTVNSINYGIAGCTLSLISVYGFINNRKTSLKLLFIITFIVGLVSIAKAGSRSPVVVLIAVCAFYFIARLGKAKGIFVLLAVVGLAVFFLNDIIELLESMGSSLGVRLTNMVVEKESSGRDEIYSNTLNIIDRAPITGEYYVIPSGVGFKGYPHNFILEVFMATGLLGGIPFMILLMVGLTKAYKILKLKHPSSWIVIIFLQVVGYGMFSTSLYSSQDFWALLFFVLSVKVLSKSTNIEPDKVSVAAHKTLVLSN